LAELWRARRHSGDVPLRRFVRLVAPDQG